MSLAVEERLRVLIGMVLSVPMEQVRLEARLVDDLGAESIDFLDLRFRVEEAFGIKVSQSDLLKGIGSDGTADDFRRRCTVQALASFLEARLEAARV
jgi:acyl carrier protein